MCVIKLSWGKASWDIWEGSDSMKSGQRIFMHGLFPSGWDRNVSHLNIRKVFNFSQWIFIELLLLRKHWMKFCRKTSKRQIETLRRERMWVGAVQKKETQAILSWRKGPLHNKKGCYLGTVGTFQTEGMVATKNGCGSGPGLLWQSGWSMTGDTLEL